MDIRYSYAHVPTIREFAASNARVRGLVGPFRSGKSSGCVVEIVRRAQAQRPGPDGIRRTRWLVVRNCFDDQTEILTERRGWQLFKDLVPEDRVATLKDGKTLTYEVPSYYYSAHHKGEMVGLQSESLDLLVTPDHRLWTSKRATRKKVWQSYSHETASKAYGCTLRRMKRDAKWEGGSAQYSEDFYEFLGFWFAEGYAGAYRYKDRKEPHWRFVVVQKRNLHYVHDLLTRAGLRWGESVSKESGATYFRIKITPDMKPLVAELSRIGHAVDKHLLLWIKDSPRAHLTAFLRGYINGDGSFAKGPHGVTRAYTSSKRLANDIQEIGLKAGCVVNVGRSALHQRPGAFKVNSSHTYRMTFMSKLRSEPAARGWYKTDYDGMVYCVEVSTHVVYVRRNGKTAWCGQTYSQLSDTTIPTTQMWLPPQYFGRYYQTDHRYVVKGFEGVEFEILFRALDKPDQVANLLSLEVTGAWINEAREVPWAIVDAIQGRIEQYPPKGQGGCTWGGLFMDTNPPDQDSDWFRFFEEKKHPDWFAKIFRQPSGRGPNAENIPNLTNPNYYKMLAEGKKPEWVKVYCDGEYGFVVDGKPVYEEYSDQLHRREVDPIPGAPIRRGWDFGLTPACCFSQLLPDGRWLVFDEMRATSMGFDQFSDDVLEHCRRSFRGGEVRYLDDADPAGGQRAQTDKRTCFEIAATKGIEMNESEQDPTLRMESVRKPLRTLIGGEPQFILHPRCKAIRKGFLGGYNLRRIQVAGPERYASRPDKGPYSHIMNALEYTGAQLFAPALTRGSSPSGGTDWPDTGYGPEGARSDEGRSEVTGY